MWVATWEDSSACCGKGHAHNGTRVAKRGERAVPGEGAAGLRLAGEVEAAQRKGRHLFCLSDRFRMPRFVKTSLR